ncbi:MAG TPA: M28 family peptidase [Gemmatimonadales bacterium]
MRLFPLPAMLLPTLLAAQTRAPLDRAAATITPQDVMRRVAIIADDSMMGRDNPSRGLELTAEYVVSELRRGGLRPAGGNGGYIQRFGLTRWIIDTSQSFVELAAAHTRSVVRVGVDARYVDGRIPDGPVGGRVILITGRPNLGEDVRDRIVLLLLDYSKPLPASLNQEVLRLAAAGPKAVLVLSNRDSATFAERLRASALPRLRRDSAQHAAAPIIEIPERTLAPLLTGLGLSPDRLRRPAVGERRMVEGLTAELRLTSKVLSHAELPNVVGILDGTDPAVRHEYVVYSAHIDHIGLSPGQPDSINNGADDNASGVAGLLELAEAFSQPGVRLRRSILFLAPSAEEPGLLGSAHFTEHPPVPIDSMVADINMDLIGRNWPDSVIAVGLEQSDLGETLQRVVNAHPELRMTPIPDRWPEERIFYRSDHYNFARKGVPILFFTSGTHPDYHRPTDQPERIDGEKESRLVRLLFYLGATVANQARRPRWTAESYRQIVERK